MELLALITPNISKLSFTKSKSRNLLASENIRRARLVSNLIVNGNIRKEWHQFQKNSDLGTLNA